jgi:tRNA threonylcarbamoyladenosine biosynthesis protein TsaE
MAKTMNCSLPFRLTTSHRSKKSGGKNSRIFHLHALDHWFRLPPSAFRLPSMAMFTSNNAAETIAFARDWAQFLVPNDVVALTGDLGAGKTQFVKGLLQGLMSADEATSPTFTLLHEYRSGRWPVFHFDFYRLNRRSEIDEIGFDEYLEAGGISVIEWADRFPAVFPERTRWMRLTAVSESEQTIIEGK